MNKKAPLILTKKQIQVNCPSCGHYKSRHVRTAGCQVCIFLVSQGIIGSMCGEYFPSLLSQREIDQAIAADKDSYPPMSPCAVCGEIWMAHQGYLCPNGQTVFVIDLGAGSLV
jgi:ribosomal protein L32